MYLRQSGSPLVYQTVFELPGTRHEFQVIRLWEQPTAEFLTSPGLLPFAVLAQTVDRPNVLRTVAQRLESIGDQRQRSDLAASAGILAGLVLEKEIIQRLLRQELMRESVIYQEIFSEGAEKGKAEGKAEGKTEVAINLLKAGMAIEQIANVTGLKVEQVLQLQPQD